MVKPASGATRIATTEPAWLRVILTLAAVNFLVLFVILPIAVVFVEAFRRGAMPYLQSLLEPDALAAMRLTLLVAAIAVPANTIFGVIASWAIAKFEFHGKSLLVTLIDLPFSVSPVVAGLVYVLVFGINGWFGGWLVEHDVQVIFAVPGIVLATMFVTFP